MMGLVTGKSGGLNSNGKLLKIPRITRRKPMPAFTLRTSFANLETTSKAGDLMGESLKAVISECRISSENTADQIKPARSFLNKCLGWVTSLPSSVAANFLDRFKFVERVIHGLSRLANLDGDI
jgi:hypothetical protein